MTEEADSSPWVVWAIKGIAVIFLTLLQAMAIFTLMLFIPWMSGSVAGLTLLISGLTFLIGNAVLLESKDVRMWGYSLVGGFVVGIGGIMVSTLWMLTLIPLPIVGNAFFAAMILITGIGFTITWFWSKKNIESQSGLIATSSKSVGSQKTISSSQLFQRKDVRIQAVELKEIPHDYAFDEEGKNRATKVIEQFHNIVRALMAIPFAFRMERINHSTRILFLTWSNDEVQLNHQGKVLHDTLSYNLPSFKFITLESFRGIVLDEDQRAAAALVTGIPLPINNYDQKYEPLEAMTGVLQNIENGVFQVFAEPKDVSKSEIRSLKTKYQRETERSERTVSRDKSGWLQGAQQESKTTINPEAKLQAKMLERQFERLSNSQLCKVSVSCISWSADIGQADMDAQRIVIPLVGSLRPIDMQEKFLVQYKSKQKLVNQLLRGQPAGDSTVLTASEAANYFLLPKTDVGIPVTKREKFSSGTRDVQLAPSEEKQDTERVTSLVESSVKWKKRASSLFIGNPIDESGRTIPQSFVTTQIQHLDSHLGVFGNTRSGKSTTVMNLIGQSTSLGINPIVLVPSKGYEWRKLMHIFPDVRIFTCGRNDLANLALNIWNPPKGVRISKWIDRVVQVLTLWMPNDDVIAMHVEDVIYTVYSNCEWNLETNTKGRPILLPDLVDAVREVTSRLNYGEEVSSNIYGALVARVKSILRKPALVNMYNTPTGITVQELLDHPTIIEMDALSENDKILLMGILTAAVSEFKLANPSEEVSNLLVLEEAHYLLSGNDASGEANSGVRYQAVNSFIEMLRVLGGTGLGVILIDQSPSSLVQQAIKIPVNMIIHALAHEDDRRVVGKHARCTDSQIDHIGGMRVGEAVVYLQFEGEPKNVRMFTLDTMIQDEIPKTRVTEEKVLEHMQALFEKNPRLHDSFALPKDIMDKFEIMEEEEEESSIPLSALGNEYRTRIQRAVRSPEYRELCQECIEDGDAQLLVDLILAISKKYGNETRASKLYVLEVTVDEYMDDENYDVFQVVGPLIDKEAPK